MPKTPRRLGRGLESLISTDYTAADPSPAPRQASQEPTQAQLIAPIDQIQPNPYQPRRRFDDRSLNALVSSIQQSGIIQPLVVRKGTNGWELIAGERRLRAARLAGLNDVPIVVREASDEEALELALIENIHREDLNAIERAAAYKRYGSEFHLPVEQIARRVGEDRSTVANYLRLLELSDDIQKLVAERAISMGHARCLLGIADPKERWGLAAAVVEGDLSVRALEEIVRNRKRGPTPAAPKPAAGVALRPLVREVQDRLTETLGVRVRIQERRKPNTGRITIDYASLDDFNRVIEHLGLDMQ